MNGKSNDIELKIGNYNRNMNEKYNGEYNGEYNRNCNREYNRNCNREYNRNYNENNDENYSEINEMGSNKSYDIEPNFFENFNLIKNGNKNFKKEKILKNNDILIEASENYDIKVTSKDIKIGKMIYKSLFLQKSKIHGIGLFTDVDIKKDTYLMKYEGEVIGKCMSDKREKLYLKNGINSIYMFEVDTDMIIDATKLGNMARYINHSCNPNCVSITNISEKSIMYFTKRDIQKGDELTIDYNSNEVIENETCNCGEENCKDKEK